MNSISYNGTEVVASIYVPNNQIWLIDSTAYVNLKSFYLAQQEIKRKLQYKQELDLKIESLLETKE